MKKPVQGNKFKSFRKEIMNLPAAKQFMMYAYISEAANEKK